MKTKKLIRVLSNGTLNFSYISTSSNFQSIQFFNKDNKNFYLNAKKHFKKIKNSNFLNYKTKYMY